MPLNLIHGPPNSGRAGLVRHRFNAALDRDPVLVVPNVDDVFAFERELCEAEGALLGGSVLTFEGLFEAVARATGTVSLPSASAAQRLRLIHLAVKRAAPRLLARSASRPGFAPAVMSLIDELASAMLDPAAVEEAATGLEESAYLGELASIYRAYFEVRDSRRLSDPHVVARAAIEGLRREPALWGERPVFLYAVDDLTREQLALVASLAGTTGVTVALTYEDRPALAARRGLLDRLREIGVESEETTAADPANTEKSLLFHLERSYLDREPKAAAPDGSLTLLRSAGERGEAEAIGAEIVRLLAAGEHPGEIAVALRDPDRRGPLYRHVLESHGIPVATEAKIPVSGTATGGALLALLRAAFTSREAGDLLAYLRGPRRARRDDVDWLERAILRSRLQSADEAAAEFERIAGRELTDLRRLCEAEGEPRRLLVETAGLARDIAEWPLAEEGLKGQVPPAPEAEELRVSATIATALEELGELDGVEPSPVELIEIIEGLRMQLWKGPAEDRVRIASPYQLRAGRFRHLFVASLQDGEFPRRDGGSPFLSDRQRIRLGLPERAETEAEERYLFYSCLSLPTAGLWLSYRVSDEDGGAEQPSPLLGEVRRLISPPREPGKPDPLDADLVRGRGLGDVTFLSRATESSEQLTAAEERERRTRAPGPLSVPAVLDALEARAEYGGTTLETFAVCSYRWFADHELAPEPLGPKPEGLTQGSLMHEALERLYRVRPGGDPLPRPASLSEWERIGAEIVAEEAERAGLSRTHPVDRAIQRRVERLLAAFLRREAARETPVLEPALLEAGFGEGEGNERPGLDLGGWLLHGRIDRIDTDGAGAGLVQDYKLSTKVAPWAAFEDEGRLQLPLYAIALRELWETEPLGALYQPLRATRDPRPRGLARATAGEELADLGLVGRDLLDDEAFEAQLVAARERASRMVERMRRGEIDRDPIGDRCPAWCGYTPICRRERGALGDRDDEPTGTGGQG